MDTNKIVEVYETSDLATVNSYITNLHWVLLQTGTKLNKSTNELTIYYSLGKPEETTDERW